MITTEIKPETDRDACIKRIRAALKKRSGKAWSVTGGRGTAWGWIKITAPPARATWSHRPTPGLPSEMDSWETFDTGQPGRDMSPADRAELGELLGLGRWAYHDGESIPAGYDYRQEFVNRAETGKSDVVGVPYWD